MTGDGCSEFCRVVVPEPPRAAGVMAALASLALLAGRERRRPQRIGNGDGLPPGVLV